MIYRENIDVGSDVGRSPLARVSISAGGLLATCLLLALLWAGVASAAECTNTWTGPGAGSWSTAGNWSAGHAPTKSDVACIGSGKSAAISGTEAVAGLILAEGSLSISGASLELFNTEEPSTVRFLTLNGGGWQKGPGTLQITGTLTWNGGGVEGGGTTELLSGAEGTITNLFAGIEEHRFINRGSLSIAGSLIEYPNAELVNEGTLTVNSEHFPAIERSFWASTSNIVNTGTIQKTSGEGASAILVPLENTSGTAVASSGTLEFQRKILSTNGSWEGTAGGVVRLDSNTISSLDSDSLSGSVVNNCEDLKVDNVDAEAADLTLQGGAMTVETGTMTVNSLTLSGGTRKGPGTLRVAETFTWNNAFGGLRGTGETQLLAGGEGTISVPFVALEDHRLVNRGKLLLTGTMIEYGSAELINQGTLTVNSELSPAIKEGNFAAPKVINDGLLQRTEGTGATAIQPPFENEGTIKVLEGKLEILHPVATPASSLTPHHCHCGDPIDCATGNFTETQADLQIGGRGVGLDLVRSYSAQAAASGKLGAFGYGWTNSFGDRLASEEGGARQTLTDASGRTVTFTKSGTSYLAPSWSKDVLSGSTEAGFTLTLPDQTKEHFSGSGRLESVTDRNSNETTLTYGGSGELKTITDPSGRDITLTYNGEGLVENAKDPMGHEVKYVYEGKALRSVTLPGEVSPNWQFKYDGSRRMTSMTDGRGGKTINEYDGSNRVIVQTDPAGRKLSFEFALFHTTITNNATGSVTDEWFNSNNQPVSVTRGFGTALAATASFTYNGGLLASRTDGNGHTTTYGYDKYGNRTSEVDAVGDETKWTFTTTHDVASMTTPEGENTTIARDAKGNPETVSRPAPGKETQAVSFEYGVHGELKALIDPLGHEWSFEYDSKGDRTAQIDPEGDKRTWDYDGNSKLTATVSPRGNEGGAEASEFRTSIERDPRGRPIKVIDPLGGTTEYEYDPNGNLEIETNPNGHSTTLSYNADDELIKVEQPNGDVEETGYDGAGEVTSQTDGNNNKTIYVRNVLEEPIETIDPLERATSAEFDAAGNLKSKTDPEERTTSYTYDAANRLREVSYSDGMTPTATFGYDKDNNLTSMNDGTGESSFEYDQLDRLTQSEDGHGDTVGYEYNLGEEQIGLTYPNGKSISREFDNAGRLESITDWLGRTTTFHYNEDSALTATTFPVGTGNVDEYGYDRADQMSSVAIKNGAETLASLSYTRDSAGQVEHLVSKGLPGAEEESLGYDANERLTNAGSDSFEYDAANNLISAPGTANNYDNASQIETSSGASFEFDEEGERAKRAPSTGPPTTYKYDQAGNLHSINRIEEGETPVIAEAFTYDGTGLMASSSAGATTQHLTWDSSQALPLLLSDGENSYIFGPGGMPVEQISSSEGAAYLHHDQLGSTRLLTNGAGEVSGTVTFTAYGAPAGKTGSAGSSLGFDGEYTLEQSGLVYLRARFYDPGTGQLMTRDPLEVLTRKPYVYAGDNPLTYGDPSGLFSVGEVFEGGLGIPIPCPWCGSGEANEVLEEAIGGLWDDADWLLRNSLGAEELDDGEETPEEQCPVEAGRERGNQEIKSAGEQRLRDKEFLDKLGHSRNANPGDPGWQPSGGRVKKAGALLGKLFSSFFHHP